MMIFFRELLKTEDTKILFILSLIAIAMIIDFALGTISARINQELKSSKGINGLLRKISSLIVLVFFIPVSAVIPAEIGVTVLYTFYVGYLMMELASILENLKKAGVNVVLFEKFLGEIHKKGNVKQVEIVNSEDDTTETK